MTTAFTHAGSAAPSRRVAVALVVALTLVVGLLSAGTADAATNTRDKPVLFVHGYNPTSNSTDCGSDFDRMISQLRAEGFTGPMVKVGFYSADVNCDVNLRSYGSFGNSSSWKEIAKALSRYVSVTYGGRPVDIVGYSMGGLIGRGAVYGSATGQSGFTRGIDVEDVVTLGTPHNGAAWYSNLCFFGQCSSLKPGATDISWLNQDRNPQDFNGTEFTTVASNGDWVTPTSSGHYMNLPVAREATYCCTPHTGSGNYMGTPSIVTRSGNALAFAAQ